MEYNGTLLDYVKQASFSLVNGRKKTLKRLEMLNDKSYTFYDDSDGQYIISADFSNLTLIAPPSMFLFKQFSTVGDFLTELAVYMAGNHVKAWDEMAGQVNCAYGLAMLNNINTVYSQIQAIGHGMYAAHSDVALMAISGFADVASHLLAVCNWTSTIPIKGCMDEDISYFTVPSENGRVYRFVFAHTEQSGVEKRLTITFQLSGYVEPEHFDYADASLPAVCKNVVTGIYYASVTEALSAAASGERVALFRDAEISTSVTVPAGVTLAIGASDEVTSSEITDAQLVQGTNTHGRLHTGAAYAMLTVRGSILTVLGTVIVCANKHSHLLDSGQRTGDYGEVRLTGEGFGVASLMVSSGGILYANGIIHGHYGSVNVNSGGTMYTPFTITDFSGGTELQRAYGRHVWRFTHFDLINQPVTIAVNGTLYSTLMVWSNMIGYGTADFPVVHDTEGLFQITTGNVTFVKPENGRHQVMLNGEINIENVSMQVGVPNYIMNLSTDNLEFPVPENIDLLCTAEGAFTKNVVINNYGLKFMPGATLKVKDGATLTVPPLGRLMFYASDDYSEDYFEHYTYDADIASSDATLIIESGGTLNVQSQTEVVTTPPISQSTTSGLREWTINGDAASVVLTPDASNSSRSTSLFVTASSDGWLSFDYDIQYPAKVVVGNTTITGSGSFKRKYYSGSKLSLVASVVSGITETQTVTISNISHTSGGTGWIASSDETLANIPHTGTATRTDVVREDRKAGTSFVCEEVQFYAE